MKRILLTILAMGIMAATYPVAMRYSQSFKFVDEDEHMVVGWLVADGKKLYQDISTNHQPLNYLASALVHKVSHPQNLFMLVQRHRQAVFLWGLVWSGILVWRFGIPMLIPLFLYEITKYWLLGNQFLAESFAAYPTLYLFGSSWQFWIDRSKIYEDWFLGICFVVASLFSIPLAIPLGILMCSRWLKMRNVYRIIEACMAMGSVTVGVFMIVPVKHFFLETILFNGKYGVPLLSEFDHWYDVVNLWLLPLQSLLSPSEPLGQLYALMGAIWLIGVIIFIYLRKWNAACWSIGYFILWGLTNARVFHLHQYYYSGFHLLPWYLVGLGLSTLMVIQLNRMMTTKRNQFVVIFLFGLVLGIWAIHTPTLPIRQLPDPQTESYVQYTPQLQVAEVIATLENPGDRLATIPNETLSYWLSKLQPATRQVTYYEWQYRNPQLRDEMEKIFTIQPPRFITYLNEGASFTPWIQQQLTLSYVKLFDYPLVYIRKDSLSQVTPEQRLHFLDLNKTHSGINTHVFETK